MLPNKLSSKGLTRSDKVRKKVDFTRNRSNSQKIVCKYWVLFFSKNAENRPRLAVTVSGKYGNSVVRNKFKRRVRDLFRQNKTNIARGVDLHFVAKKDRAGGPSKGEVYALMREDFERVLYRLSKMLSVDAISNID